ncbi:hypothetical protein K402DRAFT_408030 [Aulographum hederae CBS 113979]|uniref:Uncharacterized protein n=1 Tax=Aulographum hederae CBS 113979 TaxID=1176131 RepID=A0A6G1GLU2_9PEZI|nr:hypothetical protein K402DRAFT_408030 [Aulographum hederae CBS 113979]
MTVSEKALWMDLLASSESLSSPATTTTPPKHRLETGRLGQLQQALKNEEQMRQREMFGDESAIRAFLYPNDVWPTEDGFYAPLEDAAAIWRKVHRAAGLKSFSLEALWKMGSIINPGSTLNTLEELMWINATPDADPEHCLVAYEKYPRACEGVGFSCCQFKSVLRIETWRTEIELWS